MTMTSSNMAKELNRRFSGKNVFRLPRVGPLKDVTVVIDVSKNPSPYRGSGESDLEAYEDVVRRNGKPLDWMLTVRGPGSQIEAVEKFKQAVVQYLHSHGKTDRNAHEDGPVIFVSSADVDFSDIEKIAKKTGLDVEVGLD